MITLPVQKAINTLCYYLQDSAVYLEGKTVKLGSCIPEKYIFFNFNFVSEYQRNNTNKKFNQLLYIKNQIK